MRRSSDASSRQPIKHEGREDSLYKSPSTDVGEVAGRYEELQRQIAEQKEQLRLKQERKAKETANRNLEIQMKAESEAQEEARQQNREAKASKVARAQEVAEKLRKGPKSQTEQQRKDEEENRKADEAKEARRRKDEEAREETRRKAEEERNEASRKEQARLEEIIAKRKAAEREAQEQAEREQREEEARLADEARVQAELEKAAEVERLQQEERDRAAAIAEAIRTKQEERKEYLARLPRALNHALQGGTPVQPEKIVRPDRPDGSEGHLDYLHSLEKNWQPIPLFRGSDIDPEATENEQLYIPGFMASVYLRHERLDTVREELGWRTLAMNRQARETLWARNGIFHFIVKDHEWAIAPPEISQDCGIPIETDLAGMRQIRWGKLHDEGKEQWLNMDEEQCLWVRLEDFIGATIAPEWLRGMEIRTSAWFTLSRQGKSGLPISTPTFINGKEV